MTFVDGWINSNLKSKLVKERGLEDFFYLTRMVKETYKLILEFVVSSEQQVDLEALN